MFPGLLPFSFFLGGGLSVGGQKGWNNYWQYLLFWYHVFTWVSVRLSLAASSILSCTDKYFCLSKLLSKVCNWLSEKAVRAFLCFFEKLEECWLRPSSPETIAGLLRLDYACTVILISHAREATGSRESKMNIGASRNGRFSGGNLDLSYFILLLHP